MPFDPAAIAADAVTLAELPGGTGHEGVRIDWLQRRLRQAPGRRYVDGVGNLVWAFGPPPYRLALLVHVDDVFGEATVQGVTQRDGWLCGRGIGDNAVAVATAVAVAERTLAGPEPLPVTVVFTVGEEGLGGLRGARPDRTDPGRLHRRRRRAAARRPGRDPGTLLKAEERECCEPARTTSSRSATAGRCGSTANRSGTCPRIRPSRRW